MKYWSTTILIVAMGITARAEQRQVTFEAPDGASLQGTFYSSTHPGPGLLVLHECNGNRQNYDQLATMLGTAGYSVLTLELRDHGVAGGRIAQRTPEQQKTTASDIEAALEFMKSQSIVNPRSLGVLASGCAVNEAVHASRRHPEIRALVLLSGGTDSEGEAYIRNSPNLPILGVASEDDEETAAAIQKLVEISTNNDSQITLLSDGGYGASLFAEHLDLEADIVIWVRSSLSVAGYGLPPAIR